MTKIKVWAATISSSQGIAYGATFGTSNPHNFQVVSDAAASELEAKFLKQSLRTSCYMSSAPLNATPI